MVVPERTEWRVENVGFHIDRRLLRRVVNTGVEIDWLLSLVIMFGWFWSVVDAL